MWWFCILKSKLNLAVKERWWVGFSLAAKLPLSLTKRNCRRSLTQILPIFFRDSVRDFHWINHPNYPSDNLIYLHLFKIHNYHYWFIKSYYIKLLISAAPIHIHIKISVAFENDAVIRNLTIILSWLNQNSCGTRIKRMKQWK